MDQPPQEEHQSLRLSLDPARRELIEEAVRQRADMNFLIAHFGEDDVAAYYSDPDAPELNPREY